MSSPHASDDASRPPARSRRTLVVALVAVVVLLLGGGAAVLALSGDEEDAPTATEPGEPADEKGDPGVAVPTRVVRVAGKLYPAVERRLAKQLRVLLEEYVEDAYVGRGKAFPGFTDKARRLARRDADVTTGRRLGAGDGEPPVLRSGRVRVAVLSPRPRQPVGATAAVRLVLTADGSRSTVTGQLHLTPTRRGWQVFGYELAMSGAGGRVDASTEKDGTSGGNR